MMKASMFIAMLTAVLATKITEEDHKVHISRRGIIDEVNRLQTTWKAGISPRFANATVADFKRLLGTVLSNEPNYIAPEFERVHFAKSASDIPDSFDVRTAWPECASVSGRVRDQSNCGSCWAFGSTEAFNDRYCIATGDASKIFSAEDTNDCCNGFRCSFSMGCNGGQPSGAWKWFTSVGVSSGGDNADVGTGTSCKPYSLTSCAHHVTPPEGMVACSDLPTYTTPTCANTCSEKTYGTAYATDKHKAKTSYSVKTVTNIQLEIMEKGTVTVAMTVYEDFEAYTSGVYQHVTGSNLGGHAIKLIGWGVDNGTPYWTCVNSWNDSWGEAGLFRILRGSNECGIESDVVAGDVA